MATFLVPRRWSFVRWRGTLEGLVPVEHPARFVWQVLSSLDFSALEAGYTSVHAGAGRRPYHPRLLAALWIYGMTQGLETAAAIARACVIRDDFRWLAGGLSPSDQTLLNFLTGVETGLASIWVQVLRAMHQAGHIDLSTIAEDGTKLRANASPRSFHIAADIQAVIESLEAGIAARLRQAAESSGERQAVNAQRELRGLRLRLSRAKRAARDLERRAQRRDGHESSAPTVTTKTETATTDTPIPEVVLTPLFTGQDFVPAPDRDALVCPNNQDLRFIGEYPTTNGQSTYRLYGRRDCRPCPLRAQCTKGRGRRIKVRQDTTVDPTPAPPAPTTLPPTHDVITNGASAGPAPEKHPGGPRASITEPEAIMMLATSQKRWEPSYNADLAATRHGILVSQFLTNNPTDFAHFRPALQAVISAVGTPESWVGDGHYGTQTNVVLADQAGVLLYAPPAWDPVGDDDGAPASPPERASPPAGPGGSDDPSEASMARFSRRHFRVDPARQVLICPAEHDLPFVGEYPTDNGLGAYRLYRRRDCGDCPQKERCTNAKGRRVKVLVRDADHPAPTSPTQKLDPTRTLVPLLKALQDRMREVGDAALSFRRETIEPLNAHLKVHGLGRLHVHGLARCQAILTLACLAHNLTKWRAREAARSLKAAA